MKTEKSQRGLTSGQQVCRIFSLIMLLLSLLRICSPVYAESDTAANLIRQAGNADDDSVRLNFLIELRDLETLHSDLKSQTGTLIDFIGQWTDSPKLAFFKKKLRSGSDYEFGIPEDSPLYPIACLYRARMLCWFAMEEGNIWNDPVLRRTFLDRAMSLFKKAKDAFPENRIVRMYLGEPIASEKVYEPVENAPEWATWQREGLERLNDILDWWIENRFQKYGHYCGGWGDDCEMWRWMVPALIAFSDSRILEAQARFSESMMSQPHMCSGFTNRLTDVEHAAEDSADVITPMIHIFPNDPKWRSRAIRLTDLMEKIWTGRNNRDYLQFKSTYLSAEEISADPEKACDTAYHARVVQPALLYWQRTGDPHLGKFFAEWMNTWVDAAARAERGKPAGILPSAIHWPCGRAGGRGPRWWDPENHEEPGLYRWPSAVGLMLNTLLLTHHMTQNPKYLEPLLSMADIRRNYLSQKPEGNPEPGSVMWCAAQMDFLQEPLAKYRLLTGDRRFDDLLESKNGSYTEFRIDGNEFSMNRALKENVQALRINFEGYTSEVRYTDRVLRFPELFKKGYVSDHQAPDIFSPNMTLLYQTATGDMGAIGYFPLNAVRWHTHSRDIAALVEDTGTDRFSARLFHFGKEARSFEAEFFLLSPGFYSIRLTRSDGSLIRQTDAVISGSGFRLPLNLPPQIPCRLVIHRKGNGK